MSAIMKTIVFLTMASVIGSHLALAQNVPIPNSDGNCSLGPAFHRQYIQSINEITHRTLSALGTSKPILQPLTTPLANGLTVNPFLSLPGTNISTLSVPISTVGMGMRILARTIDSMVDQWDEAVGQFASQDQANFTTRRSFITSVNAITTTLLTDLGRQYPRMQRLTNPLSVTLIFSPVTLRGSTLFNQNQPISSTGQTLKLFTSTLTGMVGQWEATSAKFLQQEQQCK